MCATRIFNPRNESDLLKYIPKQHQFLPSVTRYRITWNNSPKVHPPFRKSPTPHKTSEYTTIVTKAPNLMQISPHEQPTDYKHVLDTTKFKGKLQNYLHVASEIKFKKQPCGLIYGTSLKQNLTHNSSVSSSNSLELCISSA